MLVQNIVELWLLSLAQLPFGPACRLGCLSQQSAAVHSCILTVSKIVDLTQFTIART